MIGRRIAKVVPSGPLEHSRDPEWRWIVRARQRQPLPGALTDLLGREERLVDAVLELGGNPGTVVGDLDNDLAAAVRVEILIFPRPELVPDLLLDRLRGVDDQIQEDLVELADVAGDRGQLTELDHDLGHVLVLVAAHRERRLDRLVDIGRRDSGCDACEKRFIACTIDRTRAIPSTVRANAAGIRSQQVLDVGVRPRPRASPHGAAPRGSERFDVQRPRGTARSGSAARRRPP